MRASLRAVVCCACAALALAPLASPAVDAGASRTVLQFGDSLAVGDSLYLPSYLRGWSVTQSADVSRHTDAGAPGLRAYGASLPRVIVVSLGANDSPGAVDWFRRQVRDVLRVAGPRRCVIWSEIVRPPYAGVSYSGLNAVLHQLDARYRALEVFPWRAMAARNPGWFGSDGVHPTATGYAARAKAIAALVRRGCG